MNDLFEEFDEIADLAEGLDDPEPGGRIMAVMELADSADPAAIPYLARAITDEDAGVRKQAAQARHCASSDRENIWPLAGSACPVSTCW